ncbi:hypothetical protein B0O80DRAFT_533802 [Mortierella sp. GBAus27b]|nr:hypothetical protein B0O80DRAFT_503685 [Mortierella sp. GBAus27b]KAI8346132.1 hypothetical protein B0O80DRAFT_533802 [Mortierella sp. GBAus27b]
MLSRGNPPSVITFDRPSVPCPPLTLDLLVSQQRALGLTPSWMAPLDLNLGFSGNVKSVFVSAVPSPVVPVPASATTVKYVPLALMAAAIKQAATARNIPCGALLEQAVMAQARAQALSQARAQALSQAAAISVPALPINSTPAKIIPKSEPLEQSEIMSVTLASSSSPSKKCASSPEVESEEVILKRGTRMLPAAHV